MDMLAESLQVQTRNRRDMPREIARAMLRPERTLTERVAELERRTADNERRIAALERERK
jgi:precorrin-6B methylase 1